MTSDGLAKNVGIVPLLNTLAGQPPAAHGGVPGGIRFGSSYPGRDPVTTLDGFLARITPFLPFLRGEGGRGGS